MFMNIMGLAMNVKFESHQQIVESQEEALSNTLELTN